MKDHSSNNLTQSGKAQPILATVILMMLCMGLLVFALAANSHVTTVFPPSLVEKHLKHWIAHPPRIKHEQKVARVYNLNNVMEIYQSNNYGLIWFNGTDFKEEGYQFLSLLREAVADDRYFYRYSEAPFVYALSNSTQLIKDISKIDLLVTDAFVSFAQDSLNNDFVPDLNSHDHHNPEAVQVPIEEQIRYTTDDVVSWIIDNVTKEQMNEALHSLVPNHDGYLAMRKLFNHFISVTSYQSWKGLPDGQPIKLNQIHDDIPLIRAQLNFFEKASAIPENKQITYPDYFSNIEVNETTKTLDAELSERIGKFQVQNGLENTGEIGPKTRKLLQTSPQRFIRKIALNMKRWRRLPEQLGEKHIMVNMAAFDLNLIEKSQSIMKMKVIVGRPNRRTPTLIDPIRSLVLNPTWTVPTRIALLDILPRVKKDPSYLAKNNIEIIRGYGKNAKVIDPATVDWPSIRRGNLPFYFRQKSGYNNALGQVKFSLPNDMAIYLHDTNHRELFAKDYRALSSGCVRVEKAIALAEALLDGKQNWNMSKIDDVLEDGKTTYVRLPDPVPVYLIYWTAFVDEHGQLQSREDVYNWDRLQFIGNDVAINDFSLAP